MQQKLTFLALLCLSFSLASAGFESPENSNVTHLSVINITNITYETPFVVLFFAPWCPHCQAFRPTYEKFATNMRGEIGVGDVDCTVELYLQDLFGIEGYPTVFYFIDGMYYEYKGSRKASALQEWINTDGYLKSKGKALPEVSEAAAAKYSSYRNFSRIGTTILVAAVILGVVGFLSYFCCFNDLRTQNKSFLALRLPKKQRYQPVGETANTAISYHDDSDLGYLRSEIA